jgi:hypothetical protein
VGRKRKKEDIYQRIINQIIKVITLNVNLAKRDIMNHIK